MASDQHLCQICTNIDLSRYFLSAINSRVDDSGFVGADHSAIRLGLFENIYQRSSYCDFCRLVVNAMCKKRQWSSTTPEAIIAQHKTGSPALECWMYSYLYADSNPERNDSQKAYRIGIATRTGEEGDCSPSDHSGDIQLLAEDAIRVCGSTLFHGRVVKQEKVDMDLPRHWLDYCEHEHGELCEAPSAQFGSPPLAEPQDLLAIDVKRQCISYLLPASRYVALSYCWPIRDTFKLTRANLKELLQPGALGNRMQELPQIIRDAIHFVLELGEAYLWIDALCIVQDNDDHKHFQLSQMDKVYGSASLTLVSAPTSADGTDPSCGLPRYCQSARNERQEVTLVQNLHLLLPFESIISFIQHSRWYTRAWTYQECLLSRRLLFFTDKQVYFQCSCSVFCEDGVGEGVSTSTRISPTSNLWNPGAPYSSDLDGFQFGSLHLRRWPHEFSRVAVDEYESHATAYAKRDLSFSSDILNAFRGLQNVMQRSLETNFWYGIPERYFDRGLLWTLIVRQTAKFDSSVDPGPRRSPFPSWSWAGWDSSVSLGAYFGRAGLRCEISWFLINRRGEAISLQTEGLDGRSEFPQNGNKDVAPLDTPLENLHLAVRPRLEVDVTGDNWKNPEYLACWTTLAVLYLTGNLASLDDHGRVWPNGDNLEISDSDGSWVGSIMMDRRWVTDHVLQTQSFEFMLMSRTEGIELRSYPQVEYFDTNVFTKRPWCLLNVMLIERKGNVARRLGIGVVHEDAWLARDPTSVLIKLE